MVYTAPLFLYGFYSKENYILVWESKAEADSDEFKAIVDKIKSIDGLFDICGQEHPRLFPEVRWLDFKTWEYPKVFKWLKKLQESYDRPLEVMDFGCGFCPFPQFLANSGFEVWGVDDDSGGYIARLGLENLQKVYPDVHYYVGNILDLDKPFDAIVSCSVIEHIPKAETDLIFPKMRELLRKNGKMCHVVDHYFPEYGNRLRMNFTETVKQLSFTADETMCPEHPDFISKSMDKIDFMYYPHKTGVFIKPARREARIMIGDDV